MNAISLKKLSEQTKIDFYQLEKYIYYLGKELMVENNVRKVNLDDLELITKFINTYTTNEIQYIMNHNIKPFFNGILMLNLRKKYNLNDKQFTTKISHIPLDYKYVYSDEELQKEKENTIMLHFAGAPGKPWRFKKPPKEFLEYQNKIPKSLIKYTFRDFRKRLFSKV